MVGLHADCDWLRKCDDALELFIKSAPSSFLQIHVTDNWSGFGKISKLIAELVVTLKKEQRNKKVLQNEISDLETSIDDANESITTLKAETTEEFVTSEEALENKQIDLMVGLRADCDRLLKYDDALELFKKSPPSSFLQIQVTDNWGLSKMARLVPR